MVGKDSQRDYRNTNEAFSPLVRYLLAGYTNQEQVKPVGEISGKEACQLYMDSTLTELSKAESRILYDGTSKDFLIGPDMEK